MGELKKMCIALVFVCLPLGCAAPLQETKQKQIQIQCKDRHGRILYTGPYKEESGNGYLVQLDDLTDDFYPKGMCRKMPA